MSFVDEFKTFIARGNAIDMAIGVIVGGAFGKIVTSLTEDIIMPPIGLILGKVDFSNLYFPLINDFSKFLDPVEAANKTNNLMHLSMEKVKSMGIPVIAYGNFLNTCLDFLIIALCVFMMVKAVNHIKPKAPEVAADPTTKICPECLSEIPIAAHRCRFCASVQPTDEEKAAS